MLSFSPGHGEQYFKTRKHTISSIYMLYSERGLSGRVLYHRILCGVQHCPLHIVDTVLGIDVVTGLDSQPLEILFLPCNCGHLDQEQCSAAKPVRFRQWQLQIMKGKTFFERGNTRYLKVNQFNQCSDKFLTVKLKRNTGCYC